MQENWTWHIKRTKVEDVFGLENSVKNGNIYTE